jgi:hypothetical protein
MPPSARMYQPPVVVLSPGSLRTNAATGRIAPGNAPDAATIFASGSFDGHLSAFASRNAANSGYPPTRPVGFA